METFVGETLSFCQKKGFPPHPLPKERQWGLLGKLFGAVLCFGEVVWGECCVLGKLFGAVPCFARWCLVLRGGALFCEAVQWFKEEGWGGRWLFLFIV